MAQQRFCKLLAAAVLAAAPVLAAAEDPPERVARLAVMEGAVSVVPADEESWEDAAPNRPVVSGDRIETGPGARAVVEFDTGIAYLDGDSSLTWYGEDDGATRLELPAGTLRLDAQVGGDGPPLEVRTPDVQFTVDEPGTFRFDALPEQGETLVTVHAGAGTAHDASGERHALTAAQGYRFAAGVPRYTGEPLSAPDAFDRWALATGERYGVGRAREYVPDGVVGYRDLDRYGDWEESDDYGSVWYPRAVDDDWAPYRYGYWSWVAPWGWTWMDAAPWGFAPFHYGRWVYVHHHHHRRPRWAWAPGPRHRRVCYAPALVGFARPVHAHDHRRAPVGWFPLGPRDIYRPAYRASDRHYLRANAAAGRWHDERALRAARHRHDGPDAYAHARHAGAVTFADAQDFGAGPALRPRMHRPDRAALGDLAVAPDPGVAPPRRGNLSRHAARAPNRPGVTPSWETRDRGAARAARSSALPVRTAGEAQREEPYVESPRHSADPPGGAGLAPPAAAPRRATDMRTGHTVPNRAARDTRRTEAVSSPRRPDARERTVRRPGASDVPTSNVTPPSRWASPPARERHAQPTRLAPERPSAPRRNAEAARLRGGQAYGRPVTAQPALAQPGGPRARGYAPAPAGHGQPSFADRPSRSTSGWQPPPWDASRGLAPATRSEGLRQAPGLRGRGGERSPGASGGRGLRAERSRGGTGSAERSP